MNVQIEEVFLQTQAGASERLAPLAEIWNQALGQEFALSAQHLAHRVLHSPTTLAQAVTDQGPVGFILLSAGPSAATPSPQTTIHIDGIVVHPTLQRQGIGRALLDWAQHWAHTHMGPQAMLWLGSGPLRLLPGLPVSGPDESAEAAPATSAVPTIPAPWPHLGFTQSAATYHDLACHVAAYTPPAQVTEIPGIVRPFASGEQVYLAQFLHDQPLTADHTVLHHFVEQIGAPGGGRITDLMGLWTADGLAAVTRIIVEDSAGGLEPWFPYTLPKPWAALQLFAPPHLAHNLHAALVDAVLRRLHNMGVNSCLLGPVADSVPYAPFGFQIHRTFQPLGHRVTAES